MKAMMLAGVLAAVAFGTLRAESAERRAESAPGSGLSAPRCILQPDCKVSASGARSIGVKVDILGLVSAKRPTKSVYIEEAVAMWRPSFGEAIAANEAPGAVSDVNGVVAVRETTVEKGGMEIISDHFKRNAGKYTVGTILALIGGAAWYLYEDAQSDGDMQARASIPSQQSPTGSQSPAIVVSGVNLAPGATININIDQPYASE